MKTIRTLMVTVGLLVALAVPSFAQTSLTSTTLAAAVTASAAQINVASATGIEVGDRVAVLAQNRVAEFMRVRAINGTFITVSRGVDSRALAHLSGATLYHAPEAQFYRDDPVVGTSCTRANELYLPHINTSSKNITQCSTAAVWYRLDQQFVVDCFAGPLATSSVDQSCWTANGNYVITGITYVSKVAESAGTLTVIPRRQQGTEAPASGDALATAISGVSTVAETVTAFTLTTTGADLLLDSGDRLGIDFTDDVAGELLGVVITFTLAPI
jgi:hypothetical protein